ncbi:MAG TPA: hypothetical protein VF221_01610 [Chloroflexota bacterium]
MTHPKIDRPTHPDFEKLAAIVRQYDNEAVVGFDNVVSDMIDPETLIYMAQQRALQNRTLTAAAVAALGISKDFSQEVMWIDAFVAGVRWAQQGQEGR